MAMLSTSWMIIRVRCPGHSTHSTRTTGSRSLSLPYRDLSLAHYDRPRKPLEHLIYHDGFESPLQAPILDLLCPRGTAPDAPPTSAKERNRRGI